MGRVNLDHPGVVFSQYLTSLKRFLKYEQEIFSDPILSCFIEKIWDYYKFQEATYVMFT
jgi:hypothetical protein